MSSDAPITEIKLTNRRRMAWLSAIQTPLAVFGVLVAGLFYAPATSAIAAMIPVIPILLVFLSWPQFAYFGATSMIDRILGRKGDE